MKAPPHPLEEALRARVRLLATTLRPSSVMHYAQTVRLFMAFLGERYPEVRRATQLRRDPHLLAWIEFLWMHRGSASGQPWRTATRAGHLIRLRTLFDLLADHAHPPRPHLLLREDIPRRDKVLPRPLAPDDDARLQVELAGQNDLFSQALLLTRLTGLRIGETVDLSANCLRHLGAEQWALHVPVGKTHSERWTPVDDHVRAIITRLRYLRTLPGATGTPTLAVFLLPRPHGRAVLIHQLRAALRRAALQAGISEHVVPHRLRHSYATSLLRAGVSLPALMKLLGHRSANMTLLYLEITQKDLQREYHLAQRNPRYLLPLPSALGTSDPATADRLAVLDRLTGAIRVLDLFRQQPRLPDQDQPLRLLLRRLVRIRSRFEKLISSHNAKN